MAHFQSYAYMSTNVNGDQKELFLKQQGNNTGHSKAFFSQQSQNGHPIKSMRGKTVNHDPWTVEANNNGNLTTHPYEEYGSWFVDPPIPFSSIFHSIEEESPMKQRLSKKNSIMIPSQVLFDPFKHPFFH